KSPPRSPAHLRARLRIRRRQLHVRIQHRVIQHPCQLTHPAHPHPMPPHVHRHIPSAWPPSPPAPPRPAPPLPGGPPPACPPAAAPAPPLAPAAGLATALPATADTVA